MSGCGPTRTTTVLDSYSLADVQGKKTAKSVAALNRWLIRNSGEHGWIGKLYVAKSIRREHNEFRQHGCSPNYNSGWWTLTCCKHHMRAAKSFGEQLDAMDRGVGPTVFVFTLAKIDQDRHQCLVSVAKVTGHFRNMADYTAFLLGTRNRKFITSRLTQQARKTKLLGWRFGDCHADIAGKLCAPNPDHEHGRNRSNNWGDDVSGQHANLVSDTFLLWRHRCITARRIFKQLANGFDLNLETLTEALQDIET